MATNNKSEAIFVTIDNERIELKGDELDLFLKDSAAMAKEFNASQAQAKSKIAARQSALSKLAALGLTKEEIDAL